jgi:hypothetical protein
VAKHLFSIHSKVAHLVDGDGCIKRRQSRSIDLILGVALPAGRSKASPSIFSPFCHPEVGGGTPAAVAPREQILATVAKVQQWARQLRLGYVCGLSAIAVGDGVSVARVSQLMVLERLAPEQIDAFFRGQHVPVFER